TACDRAVPARRFAGPDSPAMAASRDTCGSRGWPTSPGSGTSRCSGMPRPADIRASPVLVAILIPGNDHLSAGIMRELRLVVSSGDEGSYLVSARSVTGDTPQTRTMFPFDERGLARRLQDTELALAKSAAITRRVAGRDERPVQELGKELFAFLFPGRVRD